jgi:hypothetical protein
VVIDLYGERVGATAWDFWPPKEGVAKA